MDIPDNLELIERFQSMVSMQMDLLERYTTSGNTDGGSSRQKLNDQLGNLITGLGRFTRFCETTPETKAKKAGEKNVEAT
jgi:hypothetical protein